MPKKFTDYRLVCREKFKNAKFINGTYYWGGGGIENLNRPVYEVLPEGIKFENIEKWKYSQYASLETYPYLKFLPPVDSSTFPLDKAAAFPGGFKALEKAITHNIRLSAEYIRSQKLRTVMLNIMIDESGELSIVESFDNILRAYPANKTFYEQVIKSVNALSAWESAVRNNQKAKHFYSLSVLLDSGKLSVLLHSKNLINQE
ncbi:hypothetical protein GXP67_11225 [Rhodocytophaga rosea]|uniref:Uncharacterized protein n=1 Tax=Rhodocytophaga rosea TaxID=2704465 RepID=A0A6C0GH17_9BACT|nr:hypothetical protein [Rhodocytophaga rosea]QHT67175.1 hypothetical protein GXP67_11225 [Rhodocytophaga rosea]